MLLLGFHLNRVRVELILLRRLDPKELLRFGFSDRDTHQHFLGIGPLAEVRARTKAMDVIEQILVDGWGDLIGGRLGFLCCGIHGLFDCGFLGCLFFFLVLTVSAALFIRCHLILLYLPRHRASDVLP